MLSRPRSFLAANGLVLLTIGIGLLNNILIAALFGLTPRVDSFFAAMVLPSMFMYLCVDYLGKNFLPVLAIARQESDDTAAEVTSNVIFITFMLAALVTVVCLLFRKPIFSVLLPGFDELAIDAVSDYFLIMAPAMSLMAATTFHEYICQYDERYSQIVMIRMCLPLTNLAALLMLGPVIAEYSLPIGYTAGHLIVFVLMAKFARTRFRPRPVLRAHLERRVFANSAVVMSTGLIARSKSLFVNYFASMLGGGVITAIALAVKLSEPAQRSAFYAARMIMFSRTARLHLAGDLKSMVTLYESGIRTSFLVLAPALWWAGLHSHTIVALVFEHGSFTEEMTRLVALVFTALVPSVLFLGVNQLLSNAFYAMERIKVPAIVMPLGTLLYAAAAGPIAAALGPPGLTLTTTLTSGILFVVLIVVLARTLQGFRALRVLAHVTTYIVVSGFWMVGLTTLAELAGLAGLPAAVISLPLGAALSAGTLYLSRDATLRWLLQLGRQLTSRSAAA